MSFKDIMAVAESSIFSVVYELGRTRESYGIQNLNLSNSSAIMADFEVL